MKFSNTYKKDGVIHFSTMDSGGAYTGAYRIHKLILELGFQSVFFVHKKITNDNTVFEIKKNIIDKTKHKVINKILKKFIKNDKYSYYDFMQYSLNNIAEIEKILVFKPKVIFIHWVSGFLDTDLILELQRKFKSIIYITFMDLSPITGGCHYNCDCLNYQIDCANCPATNFILNNHAQYNLQKKINFVSKSYAIPTTNITWVKERIEKSKVFKNQYIFDLGIPLDSNLYKPSSKIQAKKILNLSIEKKLVLIAASSINDYRKGIQYSIESLIKLDKINPELKNNIEIVICGKIINKLNLPFKTQYLDFINDVESLINLYRAAHIFLSTSIEDAGPMMVGESMMCGTPVISFKMGIANDLIINKKSGFLVELMNTTILAKTINEAMMLSSSEYQYLSFNARNSALEKLSSDSQKIKLNKILENINQK